MNTGSSILTYNGVSLPFVKTEKFDQEVVYSSDGVDSMMTKITIGVGCVLSPCLFNGLDAATWVNTVKPRLMVRGGQLSYCVDGAYVIEPTVTPQGGGDYKLAFDCNYDPDATAVITSPSFDTTDQTETIDAVSDAKLGPFPQRFDVRRIEGNTWLAYYEIITFLPYCNGAANMPYYLSNRWSTTVAIDEDYFLTRTIDGILVLNGQYGNQTKMWSGPENFPIDIIVEDMVNNSIIIPPCPQRWKREGIDIIRSSDGLTINYKITDKQLYTAIPRPATRIDAQYTETSGTKDFALMNMMVCEIQVTVYGEANANWNPAGTINQQGQVTWESNGGLDYNKYNLMTLMFQVVLSRIPFPFLLNQTDIGSLNNPGFNQYIIQYFQMKEDVFKPIVGCTVRALKPRLFDAQTIANTTQYNGNQGIYGLTTIGSTILVEDCINDIARQPENMLNYGQFLLAAQSLNVVGGVGGPGNGYTSLTACQLASAIMYPCSAARGILTSIPSSATNLGSTNINVSDMDYAAIGANNTNPATAVNNIYNVGRYYSSEQCKNPFTEYTIDVQYLTSQGMFQLPVMYDIFAFGTTPASGCVFAQTAAPITKKVVHWKASRLGTWPMNPSPTDMLTGYGPQTQDSFYTPGSSPDQVLSYHITFADSFLLQDGMTRKYETAGVYECGLAIRLQWENTQYGVPTAVNPITSDVWETTVASTSIATASYYPNTLFVSGIIGYANGSPGGGNPNY